SEWDVKHRASVAVWAFAGPTPGDADFAAYYDQRLGNATRRIHNPYDAVPLAWQADQMETIPGLYQPEIKPLLGLRELVCLAIDATENKHYRQQLQDAPPITGHVFAGASKYLAQVGCQHTCGYYRGLDLVFWDEAEKKFVNRIKPITSDCQDFTPAPRCARCPDWGGDGH
ncbi:MAG: hypothetical protein O7A04_00075, partial [Acidobacteria bacterium]|nr:hypothetical protein [Acidobacteriota bacterium]